MRKAGRKKKESFHTIVPGTVWPFDVLFSVQSDDSELLGFLENKCGYKVDEEEKKRLGMPGLGRTVRLKGNPIVVRLKNPPDTAHGLATLAHEAFHAADFILSKAGLRQTDDSDEAWAYLIDFLVREFLIAYDKRK